MSSKKGLLIREPEVIGFMGPEELFLSPIVFPVGIKVTSFLLACLKIAKSKSLFICLQPRYIFQGGKWISVSKREGKSEERSENTLPQDTKSYSPGKLQGNELLNSSASILSVNEKDTGFEVPSETGQANLAPPTSPRVCYISVP